MARRLVSEAKDDWESGALAADGLWEQHFSSGDAFDEWADGIQEASGGRVSAAAAKSSIAGQRFQKAQNRVTARDYSDGVTRTVNGKSRKDAWEKNWIDSFSKK